MPNPAVRVSQQSYVALKQLALSSGESMQNILDLAIESYRRERFLEAANASYAALAEDPKAWADWQVELGGLDATLLDGLKR